MQSFFVNVTIQSETSCFLQQHLRKWMEVVVITHKGGQRSDGSVSIYIYIYSSIIQTIPHLCEYLNKYRTLAIDIIQIDLFCYYHHHF